jgi:transcriptional/translational regulatory protein YebC/TACO1
MQSDEEGVIIYCDFPDFSNMQKKIEALNIEISSSELQRIPNNTKELSAEQSKNVLKLLDLLEENDDVQQVFHNMELTEEIIEVMES